MSAWSPDSFQQRFGRKVVPEGSNDFQRVLDEILCSEDSIVKPDAEEQTDTPLADCKYDYDVINELSQRHEEGQSFTHDDLMHIYTDHSDNNNNFSALACAQQQYQIDEYSPAYSICPTYFTEAEVNDNELFSVDPEDDTRMLIMGATCSSNFYDHREWHSVKGDISIDSAKPKKRGKLLKKRFSSDRNCHKKNEQTSLHNQAEEIDTGKIDEPPNECKCHHHDNSSCIGQPSRPRVLQANGVKGNYEKCDYLSPETISDISRTQLTNNRLSPNVDSSGHVQLSMGLGSGRARATTECDVSPHRLLTRRNNSPNGRDSGLDGKSANANCEERPRSHSWSNGKLGTRANFKTSSLTIRQSLSVPLRNQKTNGNQQIVEIASRTPLVALTTAFKCPIKLATVEDHNAECPLHVNPEEVPKIAISKAQFNVQEDFDTELLPMSRRRAASESQTMRPRKLLTRTTDSSDQIQEHVHVRWADEKKGSSLSTSVILSNIRPRSRSYGAMDMVPHRPILKKVAG